ncbi:hypothetical protein D3C81_2122660 [compost metagenome]
MPFHFGVLRDADGPAEQQRLGVGVGALDAGHAQLGVEVEQWLDVLPAVLHHHLAPHGIGGGLVRFQQHHRQVADGRHSP